MNETDNLRSQLASGAIDFIERSHLDLDLFVK